MNTGRFQEIAARFPSLRIAVVGDFCLDRYLEIDPGKAETSIETGLEVRNVVNVRSQPGGAGTILNNLVSLGVGAIHPVGFCGHDGEGAELLQALQAAGEQVDLSRFIQTDQRRTFTYTKPLLVRDGQPPEELNRLDFKNWTPTPESVNRQIRDRLLELAEGVDAIVALDQVDEPGTGAITEDVLAALDEIHSRPEAPLILGDSRNAIERFPPVTLKVNDVEFRRRLATGPEAGSAEIRKLVSETTESRASRLFVTLGPDGILCGASGTTSLEAPAHPVRRDIDIVGAGDAVTANLAAALAAGADNREAMETAMAAASVVIHKLGTTGTASPEEIRLLLDA